MQRFQPRVHRKIKPIIAGAKFITKRLPGAIKYLRYGPKSRPDLGVARMYILTGEKYKNSKGARVQSFEEVLLKESLAIFAWRTAQVFIGMGDKKHIAEEKIESIIGEERFDTFMTNGRKLIPHYTNFCTTADANHADRTVRPITTNLFSEPLSEELIRTFHLDTVEALTLALDAATNESVLEHKWNNQLANGAYFPDLSDAPEAFQTIRLKHPNLLLWIALFGHVNPTILWAGKIDFGERIHSALEAAIPLGYLLCDHSAKIDVSAARGIGETQYCDTEDLNDPESFIIPPVLRLIDQCISYDCFRKGFKKLCRTERAFKLYPIDHVKKPIIFRIKSAFEIMDKSIR